MTSTFKCEICKKEYPLIVINKHHYNPKEFGGEDNDENKHSLDPGCHQVLHYISFCMLRNDGKAESTAYAYAEGINLKDSRKIARRLIEYATNVAVHIKRYSLLDQRGINKKIYVTVKEEYKQLLNELAKQSSLSRERYLQILIYEDLKHKCPFLKKELNKEIISLMGGI